MNVHLGTRIVTNILQMWFCNLQAATCELRVASYDFKKIKFTSCKVIVQLENLFCELKIKVRVASCFLRVAILRK